MQNKKYLNPPLQLKQGHPAFNGLMCRGARQSADAKRYGQPSNISVISRKSGSRSWTIFYLTHDAQKMWAIQFLSKPRPKQPQVTNSNFS